MICADSPCANQALCLMEEQSPTCYCVPDFHGERCELQYDECQLGLERCVNGGTCVDGVDEYFCMCAPNFTGESCECLVREEDGQISMDCNVTFIWHSTTSSSKTESFISTTETWDYSSNFEHKLHSSSIPTFTAEYTDSNLQSTVEKSFITEKITNPTDILSTITDTNDKTTFTDERVTDSFQYYSTISEIPMSTVDQNMSITLPSTIEHEMDKNQSTSIDDASIENVTELTPVGFPFHSTNLPSEAFTTSITDPIDPSELPPSKMSTSTPELNLFFTESPTNKFSSIPTLQGKDQDINLELMPTSAVNVSLDTSTLSYAITTEGVEDNVQASEAPVDPIATPAMTHPPEVIQKCDETVCKNGGTCFMSTNGVRCHCNFRYVGPFCNIPVRIQNAAFSKDSFLRHIIYRRDNSIHTVRPNTTVFGQAAAIMVRFSAKLTSREGLILLASAEGEEGYHYVALFLHNGLLQFQFSCGLQTMLLSEIEGIVNNGSELKVKVQLNFNDRYSHCNASLHVNETLAMSGEQPAWLANLDSHQQPERMKVLNSIRQSWLHLGGRPFKTMYTLSHNISRYHGFTGCINELEINNLPVAIY
uniref:EGF-like domain-containing protein n=1 Tax=Anopheles atroparvus TaxID=41427 RepID=A0AAG5DCS2_ANOAO